MGQYEPPPFMNSFHGGGSVYEIGVNQPIKTIPLSIFINTFLMSF
jgi:hypothetical protein